MPKYRPRLRVYVFREGERSAFDLRKRPRQPRRETPAPSRIATSTRYPPCCVHTMTPQLCVRSRTSAGRVMNGVPSPPVDAGNGAGRVRWRAPHGRIRAHAGAVDHHAIRRQPR